MNVSVCVHMCWSFVKCDWLQYLNVYIFKAMCVCVHNLHLDFLICVIMCQMDSGDYYNNNNYNLYQRDLFCSFKHTPLEMFSFFFVFV